MTEIVPPLVPSRVRPSLRAVLADNLRDYVSLTKPRVVSLLLLTTLAGMLLAGNTPPRWSTLVLTLVGGYLAAGAAGALNCYLDSDIDGVMSRTRGRPLPAQRLHPIQALTFGLALALLSFALLAWGVNLLTALLALAGLATYVGVYTLWLKRISTQNIVIGGAAGAIPPLVGWAAVSGRLAPEAWLLFAIIFFWTPPHFWALAVLRRDEYARAGVPMLPVVAGIPVATRHILIYTWLLVILTVVPVATGWLGVFYLFSAIGLGYVLMLHALRLQGAPTAKRAWHLYRYSLIYLALIFAAMVADHLF